MKNFNQAADNNKQPIFETLSPYFAERSRIFEIASGSGQHAIHFTEGWPQVEWLPSELPSMLGDLAENLALFGNSRIHPPVALEVSGGNWPELAVDAVYTANTLHILSRSEVADLMRGAGSLLKPKGVLAIYGPFKYHAAFTTPSNAAFDDWLKQHNPQSGIRDFEWVDQLAAESGLGLLRDYPMPANNQLLLWQKHDESC